MGRPQKPTGIRVLEGTHPERINVNEPRSPEGLGEPPAYLDELGREAWSDTAKRLREMKLAHRADAPAVALYCANYSTWRKANETVAREGMTIETETTVKAHPLIPVANEAQRTMIRLLSQFGMTPSSRATLAVQPSDQDDELMTYIAKGRKHSAT